VQGEDLQARVGAVHLAADQREVAEDLHDVGVGGQGAGHERRGRHGAVHRVRLEAEQGGEPGGQLAGGFGEDLAAVPLPGPRVGFGDGPCA
jgi:hypothetical protein